MSTINISLPYEQVSFVDQLVANFGFANRSEFVRSLLRLITHRPELIKTASTFPFVAPKERSVKKIMDGFRKTKRYSSAFLKDLQIGLSESNYFKN
ncbi:hypothetical protein HZB78_01495 [Candidatus Collierbacteria bacterium]|nr:hypothetical protein [Candidatus Collierbacteria bacterium]